jgi:hypothetical protein
MSTSVATAEPLKRALRFNSLFSCVSGLILLAAAPFVAGLFAIPDARIFVAIGAGLLVFAAGIFLNARRDEIRLNAAWVTIALDAAWVVGSAGLLLLAPGVISPVGRLLVAIVAVIVGGIAFAQYRGVRQLR